MYRQMQTGLGYENTAEFLHSRGSLYTTDFFRRRGAERKWGNLAGYSCSLRLAWLAISAYRTGPKCLFIYYGIAVTTNFL